MDLQKFKISLDFFNTFFIDGKKYCLEQPGIFLGSYAINNSLYLYPLRLTSFFYSNPEITTEVIGNYFKDFLNFLTFISIFKNHIGFKRIPFVY